MKSVRKSWLFLIISGSWFATSAAVLFFAGSKSAPAYLLSSLLLSRRRQMWFLTWLDISLMVELPSLKKLLLMASVSYHCLLSLLSILLQKSSC